MSKKILILILLSALTLNVFADNWIYQPPAGFKMPTQDIGGPILHSIPTPDDPLIQHYITEYSTSGGQKTMTAILKRGAPYLGFIYDRLLDKGMPFELMYLPAIESGFRAWALSRSGAAGFWQFMMNSIAPYDIEVNEWRDDRRDFWKATDAALAKLQYNYQRTGSWPLAVAAYNCGLGRIERAVAASGSSDYIELYEQGYIPRETRNYVPKFFAFAHLAGFAEISRLSAAAVFSMDTARKSADWERIELKQAVNLVILASKAGIPVNLLHEANAELRHGITPPAGSGYFLKVPAAYSDNVRKVLETTEEPLMRFYIHEIQGGDTLYALSRHFGVSVSMIEMYNPAADARALRSGQKIIIPALKETGPYRSDYKAPERWTETASYTVKAGDSLWSISRAFNTTVEEITFNNGMSANDTLKAGRVIQVPQEF
ncbi:MAG: LysM peptidoglycan-binding domain-containing protein [Spirochaetales bacterium]|uniref:LysM peptidoglycan-binding domain-containing protein n=1 Tax=Candidatus Thalassospirochaeta sargassi TaxID=3119039 RepID=A0AAJ1MHU5_9SPIO|nr:LysM peptidoglycan-binding domain-containing protein [Spirochaetales bacterium]